jgi:2-C-methyl-D-erythritol 4-phosphate cytidylyltransferase
MFRYGLLHAALEKALADGYEVSDESSAMEHVGHRPLLVEGHPDNIKITHPTDLPLAEFFLKQQGRL